jgi:hypothetical protein
VDISNDGGAGWVSVENTPITDNSWLRVVFRVEDYVTPTSNMKLRFIASDEGAGSLVEAAVDDFRLLGLPSTLAALDPGSSPGALFLAVVAGLPTLLISQTSANFFFGGTSLLIVVGVALDTVKQLEAQLMMRNYEGFLK